MMTPQPKKETFARIVVVGRAVRLLAKIERNAHHDDDRCFLADLTHVDDLEHEGT